MTDVDPNMPAAEPIEDVERRVRRRLLIMAAAVILIPSLYVASSIAMHRKTLAIVDCLPPGVTLETLLTPDSAHPNVAAALQQANATVQNGVLVDGTGRPIAFDRSDKADDKPKSLASYHVIKIRAG